MIAERSRLHAAVVCIVLCACLASLLLASDFSNSATASSQFGYDLERRARHVPAAASAYLTCDLGAQRDTRLAVSIISAETLTRGPVEAVFEAVVIRIGSIAELKPPPFSLGPAQIRYDHFARGGGTPRQYWDVVRDPCATLKYVIDWLDANGIDGRHANGRRAAFARWSGHAASGPSATRYENLAYFGFAEMVFARVSALMRNS